MSDEDKNYITPGGYRRLQEELARLWKVERPATVSTVPDRAPTEPLPGEIWIARPVSAPRASARPTISMPGSGRRLIGRLPASARAWCNKVRIMTNRTTISSSRVSGGSVKAKLRTILYNNGPRMASSLT